MDLDWVTFLALSKAIAKRWKSEKCDAFWLMLIATRGSEDAVDEVKKAFNG
jgi:hypothetical protein